MHSTVTGFLQTTMACVCCRTPSKILQECLPLLLQVLVTSVLPASMYAPDALAGVQITGCLGSSIRY